ncbi:cysteine hydrolase [Altererythrobacter sp. CC-YST694]|uniref:cysteine hydrolase family protein n=1 Tax=Altererythrobacter sp. CC-YST694 TaxID=2755038 RepID=UPI001D01D824|nr:cysteine hydrolase [Altererythrobacter sp. CC-YST694]MCB5425093.1 cysteine hydrolase [Altererythrobacter sp. CC-YST694]
MHEVVLPEWAVERGKWLNSFGEIDPARTALVIVDMQGAFVAQGEIFGNPHAEAIIPNVNRLAGAMRTAGGAVIWTRQTVSGEAPLAMAPWQYDPTDERVREAMDALTPGAPSHDLHPEMERFHTDLVLDKYRYSAFACPSGALEATLRQRGIEMLVVAGTLTNVCCESTARDAYMRGFKVIFLSDATATVCGEEHNAALLSLRLHFADVRDTAAVISMLDQQDNRETS